MPVVDLATLVAEAERKAVPAVRLVVAEEAASRLGGASDLAEDRAWPTRNGRPLSFIAQLDCAALHAAGAPDWVPASGMLFFFVDMVDTPWGFDPAHRGGWAVIHDPCGPSRTVRAVPDGSEVGADELPDPTPLAAMSLRSLPGLRRLDGEPDDADGDSFSDLRVAPFGDGSLHQVGGWPNAVQQDRMELECALASNGVYCGDGDAYRGPQARALEAGAADWRLLLQLDTDEHHGMMWGDDGRLFFWIREEDARAGRWDATWMILQCY